MLMVVPHDSSSFTKRIKNHPLAIFMTVTSKCVLTNTAQGKREEKKVGQVFPFYPQFCE